MAITQCTTSAFKIGLLNGQFDFSASTSQVFKVALYAPTATLNESTVSYTTTDEVVGAGYTAGGLELTITTYPTYDNNVAYMSFGDALWLVTTLTARGALIYKEDGLTNPTIAVLEFGEDKTTNSGDFEIKFPLVNFQNAIVRVG